MKIILTLILIIVSLMEATKAKSQQIVLYSQPNSEGESITLAETYVDNLESYNFDDHAMSICLAGIWILYEDKSFNPDGERGVEYFLGSENNCYNLLLLAGKVSSVRYVGSPRDYQTDSLTVYEHNYFQGSEEYIGEHNPLLELIQGYRSIIITGNSPWTIYDQTNYKGRSNCLLVGGSGTSTPTFFHDIVKDESMLYGAIRSVKKGCDNSRNDGKFGVK